VATFEPRHDLARLFAAGDHLLAADDTETRTIALEFVLRELDALVNDFQQGMGLFRAYRSRAEMRVVTRLLDGIRSLDHFSATWRDQRLTDDHMRRLRTDLADTLMTIARLAGEIAHELD
jgi:C4-dicarboxylate-specific signal transduction histidine kinase